MHSLCDTDNSRCPINDNQTISGTIASSELLRANSYFLASTAEICRCANTLQMKSIECFFVESRNTKGLEYWVVVEQACGIQLNVYKVDF
jgi:hypothetical protein